ncbi:MAG: TonB-dependent receptor, partial [Methylococcus sp.]|nr:TonB-dependent receptor [Methylococcus sp.]
MPATIRISPKRLFPLSILIFVAAAVKPVQAQEIPLDLHIAPQNLSSALNELSRQSKVQIIADGSALQGKKTAGFHGKLALRQALEKLLAGAGLGFRFITDNAVAIKAEKPPAADPPHTLKKMTVTAAPSPLEEGTYNPSDAVTATKTDTPIMETPASVEIVPQQVLKDQQITRVGKALENVSGVTNRPSGVDGDFDLFNLRGFYYGDRIYRDGVPIKVGSFWNGQRDVANIDRIEVLKGPGAVLYGRTEPGGLVNIVTKQPQPEPYHALMQQIGNWNLFRTTLDSTGPVPGAGQLSYRFNFDFEKAGSFRQFVSHDRKFFAPVLRWDITPQTRMNFELEYRESANTVDSGLPLVNGWNSYQHPGLIPLVPITRNYGEPSDRQHIQETLVGLNWTHAFNEDWSLFHRFNAVFSDTGLFKTQPLVVSTAKLIDPEYFAHLRSNNQQLLVPRQHIGIGSQVYYNTLNLTGHF